jgi:hypothetical protein
MITEEKAYAAFCDRCKKTFEDSFTGFTIFVNQSDLWDEMNGEGWNSLDDKVYCPKCHTIDDEDNVTVKPA